MGIGKKPARASELDTFWPEIESDEDTDWNEIIRYLMRPAPGLGLSIEAIGNLTIGQLEFLLSPEGTKKNEPNRRETDRQACGVFLRMMKRTGWSIRRLEFLPTETLCQNYAIDSDGIMPGARIVGMQLRKFIARYAQNNTPKPKPKDKKCRKHPPA